MTRVYWIKIFFLVFFFAIIARLFYWQIIQGQFLQAQAEEQHLLDVKKGALRGNIFYSDGFMLASSNPTFRIYGLPKAIPDGKKIDVAYTLAKFLT